MKGLLMMDWLTIKKMKQMLLIFVFLCLLYLVLDIGVFMVAFIPIVLTSIWISVSLSEYSSGNTQFLFTLPFDRKTFVTEKYLFCIGSPLVLLMILSGIYLALKLDQGKDLLYLMGGTAAGILLLASLMIPLTIKYRKNAQNYRSIVMVIFILIFAGGGQWLSGLVEKIAPYLVWFAAIPFIALGFSWWISLKLITREEF